MSSIEWASLQEALYIVFAPAIGWWLALFLVFSFIAAGWVIWLGLLAWLSKPDERG